MTDIAHFPRPGQNYPYTFNDDILLPLNRKTVSANKRVFHLNIGSRTALSSSETSSQHSSNPISFAFSINSSRHPVILSPDGQSDIDCKIDHLPHQGPQQPEHRASRYLGCRSAHLTSASMIHHNLIFIFLNVQTGKTHGAIKVELIIEPPHSLGNAQLIWKDQHQCEFSFIEIQTLTLELLLHSFCDILNGDIDAH